jgi:hypothetical protein
VKGFQQYPKEPHLSEMSVLSSSSCKFSALRRGKAAPRRSAIGPCWLFALLALGCAAIAHAQYVDVDASAAGEPVKLTVPWRFHADDNPTWAATGFDDSEWQRIPPDKDPLPDAGPARNRYGWYRLRIKLPATQEDLALAMGPVPCEVYADGRFVGRVGRVHPQGGDALDAVNVIPLPKDLNGRTVTLAVRAAWLWSGGGILSRPSSEPSIAAARLQWHQREAASNKVLLQQSPIWFADCLALSLGVFSLGLFLLRPRSTEYGWVALAYLLFAIRDIAFIGFLPTHQASVVLAYSVGNPLLAAYYFATVMYVWGFSEARRGGLFRAAILVNTLLAVSLQLEASGLVHANPVVWNQGNFALFLAFVILISARLGISARQGNRNAQFLLIPLLLQWGTGALAFISWSLSLGGLMNAWTFNAVQLGQVTVTWLNIFTWLSMASMGLILVVRFSRSAEREQRLSSELEAARTVQQILVPEEIPTISGFAVEAVYHPAGQVGGDFYQVLPAPNGGLLAVIGDVSGKGMPAAMTVSLLVGTVRTLVHYTQDPAAILTAMNQRMIGRNNGGFTTALVLRLDPDGALTAANAGHIAPYANGKELSIDNGLPLGITSAADYSNTTLHLKPNTTLTLLTDGVVEAQNAKGELFGFHRTLAISTQTAEEIARVASTFGQTDDITVLSLACRGQVAKAASQG